LINILKSNSMESVNLICFKCKNYRDFEIGCDAFPNGIPNEIILGQNDHSKPLEFQTNDIVFEEGSRDDLKDLKAKTYNDYPEAAVNNAKRALKWVEANGWGTCGTPVGKARARQLANREPLSRDTIARMASFKRHQQHADVPYTEGCGGLMWDAWGGTAGVEWAIRKLKEIDND